MPPLSCPEAPAEGPANLAWGSGNSASERRPSASRISTPASSRLSVYNVKIVTTSSRRSAVDQERVGAERPNLPQFPGGAVSENENENATEDAIVEETLVEEVSIDGMCGVY
jgi:mycofactocin precursor